MFVQYRMKKKTRAQNSGESRDIDKNKIVQWLGVTFGIIRRLATEWRLIPLYNVVGNMVGSNKRWRQKQFQPS